jgi:hypothetical protein
MTMKTQDDYTALLTRFYGFCDGVLRSVQLRYDDDGTREVELAIACRDSQTSANEGWVTVRVLVRNVQEFSVMERPRTTLQVLPEGLHIRVIDEAVGVEFGGAIEAPESISQLRKSDAFAVGEQVDMEVGPYY